MIGAQRRTAAPRRGEFSQFLLRADAIFYDFLGTIATLREMSRQIDAKPPPGPQTQSSVDALIEQATEFAKRAAVHPDASSGPGEAVRDDETFRQALAMTQDQVRRRIERLPPPDRIDSARIQLRERALTADPDELAAMFGSLTRGWDTLVEIKLRTWQPDPRRRAIDAWLVTLVSEGERVVRDFSTLALSTLGAGATEVLDRLFAPGGLGIQQPRPSELIGGRKALDVLVRRVAEYAEQGSAQTMRLADAVGEALGFDVFPSPSSGMRAGPHPKAGPAFCPGIDPGFVDLLAWLCPKDDSLTARALWDHLVALRRRTIHNPAGLPDQAESPDHPIYDHRHDVDRLVITDFVGALGLRYGLTLTLMTPLRTQQPRRSRRGPTTGTPDPEVLRRKLGGEFRVVTKSLLDSGDPRYALTWALCELAMTLEGGRDEAPMLAMNAFFARQELDPSGECFVTREEIQAYDVEGKAPRYELLKRCLLREFRDVEKLLDEVVETHNMTNDEVEEWPALEQLRRTPLYAKWRRKRPRVTRTR